MTCPSCGTQIGLGEEILYGKHLRCARQAADERRQAAGEAEDTVEVARAKLAAKGRIVLTRRQLRELVAMSGVVPVRRPDRDAGRIEWYSRLAGWDPRRLERGLSAEEAAGLWLDHLDVGRQPPVRHADLDKILAAIDRARAAA